MAPSTFTHRLLTIASSSLLAVTLSSCTVLLTLTDQQKTRFEPSDTREDVHKELGKPRSTTRFNKTIPLKAAPRMLGKTSSLSRHRSTLPVSSREDFVIWGDYSAAPGGFSDQASYALISGMSLFLLEPFLAPVATINWIAARFQRNKISVWYSPSGKFVNQQWEQ